MYVCNVMYHHIYVYIYIYMYVHIYISVGHLSQASLRQSTSPAQPSTMHQDSEADTVATSAKVGSEHTEVSKDHKYLMSQVEHTLGSNMTSKYQVTDTHFFQPAKARAKAVMERLAVVIESNTKTLNNIRLIIVVIAIVIIIPILVIIPMILIVLIIVIVLKLTILV